MQCSSSMEHNVRDFGASIFPDDEDAPPVDMDILKDKIQLVVPLPEMDFGEASDDLMEIDRSIEENILGPLPLTSPDHLNFKGSLKQEIEHPQIEASVEGTVLKQIKPETFDIGNAVDVSNATVTAAKVAAEVSADVMTGGIVAESGPPPDFSLWTSEDDILLKNAMEVGAAIEALAKGAVKFSQRYTVRELRERWRALLYDPEVSQEAALRMLRNDTFLVSQTKITSLNRLKYPQVSNRKRKTRSVRACFYKMRKKLSEDKNTDNPSVLRAENEATETMSDIASKKVEPCPEENVSQVLQVVASDVGGEVVQAPTSVSVNGVLNFSREPVCLETPEERDGKSLQSVQELNTYDEDHLITLSQSSILPTTLDPSETSIKSDVADKIQQKWHDGQQIHPTPVASAKSDDNCIDVAAKRLELHGTGEKTSPMDRYDKKTVEPLICVLNTEDTDIPSPPPGTAHAPSLFSNMYFPSDIMADKHDIGITGTGYQGGNDFLTSRHELQPLVSVEEKTNAARPDIVVKPEPCLEVLGSAGAQDLLSASSPSADRILQTRSNVPVDLSDDAGKRLAISEAKVNADNISTVNDLSMLHSEVPPGATNEPVLTLKAGGGQAEQVRCTDPTADPILMMKGGSLQQDDDGLESDDEMPSFSDVEAMILDMDLDPVFDEDALARAESRRMYQRHRKTLMRLEQGASAALERALTLRGAIAVFYGYYLRYFITKNEVSLGRVTLDSTVDIDLGKEGRANKVSRKQATIKLKKDGVFYLKNLGRRNLSVNNIPIPHGQHASLGSNCLIEVGGMRFIFEINKRLVRQRIAEAQNVQHNGELGSKYL